MSIIYTIGHSSHPLDAFIALLHKHGISAVGDVRSHPVSKRFPHFSKPLLEATLRENEIRYVFLGKELGARSNDPEVYVSGRVCYQRLAESEIFKSGIERLESGSGTHKIAMMCAERDPIMCHRMILVGRTLVQRGHSVMHILSDGTIETHTAALNRLLEQHGISRNDMFRPVNQAEDEAYRAQEKAIAYADPSEVIQ